MSNLAIWNYIHLLVISSAIISAMWGVDVRIMWTVITYTAISAVMVIHKETRHKCNKPVVTSGMDVESRCTLGYYHNGVCVDFEGNNVRNP